MRDDEPRPVWMSLPITHMLESKIADIKTSGRPRHTSLPLECHRNATNRTRSAAKAAALRVNLNVQGCGIVAPPMHASSRTPLLLPLLLSHNLPTPRVH